MSKQEKKPDNFESALAELEAIVAKMEAGQLTLADSLDAYKRGSALLQYCQAALRDAQQQVEILEGNTLKEWSADDN